MGLEGQLQGGGETGGEEARKSLRRIGGGVAREDSSRAARACIHVRVTGG